ncbi:MAG: large subunit ribosomal protein L9 [Francisellaceae bacterium]|jgi:large subunit ribosomal protein L9
MEIILKEKVENLGKLGQVVNVKSGYARNFLVPHGKAVIATKDNIAVFEKQKSELEKLEKERYSVAQSLADKIEGKTFKISAQAGEEGKLFGSIGTKEIADTISAVGVEVEKRHVRMPEGIIRQVGEYQLSIHLAIDVDVNITVSVEAE